jgi:hypothetical protein
MNIKQSEQTTDGLRSGGPNKDVYKAGRDV